MSLKASLGSEYASPTDTAIQMAMSTSSLATTKSVSDILTYIDAVRAPTHSVPYVSHPAQTSYRNNSFAHPIPNLFIEDPMSMQRSSLRLSAFASLHMCHVLDQTSVRLVLAPRMEALKIRTVLVFFLPACQFSRPTGTGWVDYCVSELFIAW